MVTQTIRLVEKVDRRPEMRERIRADFLRLPGLKLTLEQSTRLWASSERRATNCSNP